MIVDRSSDDVIRQQAIKEGMKTLHRNAADEVLTGVTTIDEIMRVINVRTE
jgi:type II secretory ATPase GspE/PulE/Tfp pilus assembly ATPase PilB-like protein